MDANRFSRNKSINAGDRNKSLARLWRSRFLFSEKMTSLVLFDMYFVLVDIFCQYVDKIAKVTMGDLQNKGDLSNGKIL